MSIIRRIALALAGITLALLGYGLAHLTSTPAGCAFDGGGYAANASLTVTDTGSWVCADGTLVHAGSTPQAVTAAYVAHARAFGWVHLEAVPRTVRRALHLGQHPAVMVVTPRLTVILDETTGQAWQS